MAYDVERIRSHFPALAEGAAHFDGPGGSQVPDVVGRAVADTLTSAISNRGTVTSSERRAEAVVGDFRLAMADLLGADPRGIVYGRSATALTYDLARAMAKGWGPGDEVVVTRLDHDSNIRPWVQAAEAVGATVRWVDFDPTSGEMPTAAVAEALSDRTRLVATTAAGNLIGTRPDTAAISEAAHAVGALHWVDGVHATAHLAVDVAALGADVWTCSPYKFLGPHCGVLAADPALLETLHPDKLLPSSDAVPERFELGTLPYELLAGATAAVDFLAGLDDLDTPVTPDDRRERLVASMAALEKHEEGLLATLEPALRARRGVTVWSNAARRTPTLLFSVTGRDPQDVRGVLASHGVNAPAGSFYAVECSRHLGLGDTGGVRVGLAPYTNRDDVDRLLTALDDVC
ncbi:cysteine desulfurase-like protein [Phycicoccus sp.]|uniref:cysteine desulfurase-like protein n=1 Tax=Phycicoccus sp. TaxID=1902410 RepID=UPI002C620863|nr:cysteine desulfurase-like protein [Phycicoccus sp.]HMM95074.1 cysteine desulfurase-like protein [Phycicoccus sp.]